MSAPSKFLTDEARPIFQRLTGTLGDVIHGAGDVAVESSYNRDGFLQRIRFWCSSAAYARLVRIKIQVDGAEAWSITPLGPVDDLGVVLMVSRGQRLRLSVIRGEDVDPSLVPVAADTETFRVEAFG